MYSRSISADHSTKCDFRKCWTRAALSILVCFAVEGLAYAQPLNEHCIVSVLNRTAQVRPDGSWELPNIPSGFGPVRARATCVEDGITRSGESDFFTITPGRMNAIPPIILGPTTPIPQTLTLTAGSNTLFQVAETTQLTVTATYAGGTPQDVTQASRGTTYLTTNAAIATVGANGLVTAVRSGTVLIRAVNEGTAGLITIQVLLAADTDGDGIADDVEVREGLNPNDPTDGLQDADHDGLSNRDEIARGTNLHNPDTDGDGILDGEEVVAGADGYVTNPLLADTDGDGIRDALEIATGTDPTNPASFNLALAMSRIDVTPTAFALTVNSVIGEASVQLSVIGFLTDGTSINLTSTLRGTNYSSSNLNICNFGAPDGRVFAGSNGSCTITVTNSGFTAQVQGTVSSFTPTPLSFVSIPGFANNVDVSGNFAYVAAGATGLQVVNIANRNAPVIVAARDTPGNANDVVVVGNVAYVADGSAGLQIIDITNPLAPAIVGTLDTPGDAWDVVVRDNKAYVADGASGLRIIDVSSPANPRLLGSVDPPGTQKGVDVDVARNLAILASGTSGIHVVNIANPAAPVVIGTVSTGGDARDVAIKDNFAIVADFSRSMTTVDLSVPTAPVVRASTPQSLGGLLQDVTVVGRFALGADVLFVNGVPIVDISDPANPIPRAILNFGNFRDDNGTGIAADAAFVYLTAERGLGTENGTTGDTRLYIGQYLSREDRNGIAPTIQIVSPASGSAVIEGSSLAVRVDATDDIAVAAVNFLVNGQVVFTDTTFPYEFTVTAPSAGSTLTLGATAVDLGGNIGTAPNVQVNVIPDPLTTVTGRVVDVNGGPVNGAAVSVFTSFVSTSGSDGGFTIGNVPTVRGNVVVSASIDINGTPFTGQSGSVAPVAGGTTNVGSIVVTEPQAFINIVPANSQVLSVGNCIPFGDNVSFGFTGFIYRNVPAFQMRVGGHFSFDLGSLNDVDIRRNIYFAVASANPAPGGASQSIRALSWTQVTSDSQIPQNPRGDSTRGNYELTYAAEAPFDFPGGGLIVGFGGSPPGAYADSGCNQVLVQTSSADSSGFFHRRFYFQADRPLTVLDVGNSDTSSLGGIVIQPNR